MRDLIIRISILTLLSTPFLSVAQMVTVKERPSFYLGKRSTLMLNVGIQPTLSPMNNTDKEAARHKLINIYGNIKPELTYTLALNNRIALFAKGALNKSSRAEGNVYARPENSQYYSNFSEDGIPQMSGTTLGGGVTFFRKHRAALAPIGSHFSMGFVKHKYNVTYRNMTLEGTTDYPDYKPVSISLNDRETSFSYYAVEFAFGTNQPITENLFYHLGFSTSLSTRLLNSLDLGPQIDDSIDRALYENNIGGLLFRDVAVLKIGLGYALF